MESYLQYNVQSVFSFGLDSAVQLAALALHSRPRGRTQKGLWAPNQQRMASYPLLSRMRQLLLARAIKHADVHRTPFDTLGT